jgi:oxygen-independent coproporphyrinogen-3 oxidase
MPAIPSIVCREWSPEAPRRHDRYWVRHVGYPPPAAWSAPFAPRDYASVLRGIGERAEEGLSVFLQIPFCSVRCLYCSSNVAVSHSGDEEVDGYLEALERELDLVAGEIGTGRTVLQLHLGGGAPNSLSESQLLRLLESIEGRFQVPEDADTAVNCDPRRASAAQFDLLRAFGIRTVRFGVPDVTLDVQRSIGRIQSIELLRDVCAMARAAGFDTVSLDLTYGLPSQTEQSFRTTLEAVADIEPDRIACFGFARPTGPTSYRGAIGLDAIPSESQRSALLQLAVDTFTAAGYAWIGLDHFARPDDELSLAQAEQRLRRNLLGYTAREPGHVLAFGVGSMGEVDAALVQNEPTMGRWRASVARGTLPVSRGYRLSEDDCRRREAIDHLLCNLELPVELAAEALADGYDRLARRVESGWVELAADRIVVTPRGRPFLCELCADLEQYPVTGGRKWLS